MLPNTDDSFNKSHILFYTSIIPLATTRTVLDESSPLYKALCSANNSGQCVYPVVVRLENDLACTGVECNVDTLSMIKIKDSPALYYEYMPPPCIEMAFPKEVKKVVDDYNRVMCADPGVMDTVGDACCPSIPPATAYWTGKLLFDTNIIYIHRNCIKLSTRLVL